MNSSNAFLPYVAMPGWSWASILDKLNASSSQSSDLPKKCEFLESFILKDIKKLRSKTKILVAQCATGNEIVEMAKRGFQVYGAEDELELLDPVVPKLKRAHVEARIFPGNTYVRQSRETFECIVSFEKAFHRITSFTDAMKYIQLWRSKLTYDGILAIEVIHPNIYPENDLILHNSNGSPLTVSISFYFLPGDGIRTEETISLYIGNDQEHLQTQRKRTFRWWSAQDIEKLMYTSGFQNVSIYKSANYSFIIGRMKNGSN